MKKIFISWLTNDVMVELTLIGMRFISLVPIVLLDDSQSYYLETAALAPRKIEKCACECLIITFPSV